MIKLMVVALLMMPAFQPYFQKKLQKRMSKLTLVTEVVHFDPDTISLDRGVPEEEQPLLGQRDRICSTPCSQREETKLTKNISLVLDCSLPAQVGKHTQLLLLSEKMV